MGVALGARLHEDVARLQIAVDDELAVRVGDGVADLREQRQPGLDAQVVAVGVGRDGLAFHVLHREEGAPVVRCPAIQEPRDAGVLQPREDPPLGAEPREEAVRQPGAHELERDPLLERPVGALRQHDGAHPAAPDLANHPVRPDDRPRREALWPRRGVEQLAEALGGVQHGGVRGVGGEHRLGPLAEAVGEVLRVQVGALLVGREVERGVEERVQAFPVGGCHAGKGRWAGAYGDTRKGRRAGQRRGAALGTVPQGVTPPAPLPGRRAPCASRA